MTRQPIFFEIAHLRFLADVVEALNEKPYDVPALLALLETAYNVRIENLGDKVRIFTHDTILCMVPGLLDGSWILDEEK